MENPTTHILVVDDDTRLRLLLQRFLRDNGMFVSTAKNVADAREMLQNYKFDLLIVDIMMPDETGLEFLTTFRQESNLPVILLTAMGETEDRIAGLETGADDYLPKPFEPKELVLRIKNILKRTPVEKAVAEQKLNLGLCCFDMQKKELLTKPVNTVANTKCAECLIRKGRNRVSSSRSL